MKRYNIIGLNKATGKTELLDSFTDMIYAIKSIPDFTLAYGQGYTIDVSIEYDEELDELQ